MISHQKFGDHERLSRLSDVSECRSLCAMWLWRSNLNTEAIILSPTAKRARCRHIHTEKRSGFVVQVFPQSVDGSVFDALENLLDMGDETRDFSVYNNAQSSISWLAQL